MTIDPGTLAVDAAAGTWDRLAVRLSDLQARHVEHYLGHDFPWGATAYFVGGPLDGTIQALELRHYWPLAVFRAWDGHHPVDYRLSARSLPTGLPVFTCLATD